VIDITHINIIDIIYTINILLYNIFILFINL